MLKLTDLLALEKEGKLKGIFTVDNDSYHLGPGISRSSLDKIKKSPAHYLASKDAPMDQTPALIFGQALHDALLSPDVFAANYAFRPEGMDGRSKAYKDWATQNEGKILLKDEEKQAINGILKSIHAHPIASQFFKDGEPERAVYWNDPITGLLCKCKPDWLRNDALVVDIKTTIDASYEEFSKSIYNYGYHRQAAWYVDGIEESLGRKIQNFVTLACEKEPPFAVALYDIDDGSLDKGREEYRKLLDRLTICQQKGEWPSYPIEVQSIAIPHWAWGKE